MKKLMGFILILSLLLSIAVQESGAVAENVGSVKSEYLVQINDSSAYEKQKKEWARKGKIVVNHKKSDEEYLESSQSAVVSLTKEEADAYDAEANVMVEENFIVEAQNEKNLRLIQKIHFKML